MHTNFDNYLRGIEYNLDIISGLTPNPKEQEKKQEQWLKENPDKDSMEYMTSDIISPITEMQESIQKSIQPAKEFDYDAYMQGSIQPISIEPIKDIQFTGSVQTTGVDLQKQQYEKMMAEGQGNFIYPGSAPPTDNSTSVVNAPVNNITNAQTNIVRKEVRDDRRMRTTNLHS